MALASSALNAQPLLAPSSVVRIPCHTYKRRHVLGSLKGSLKAGSLVSCIMIADTTAMACPSSFSMLTGKKYVTVLVQVSCKRNTKGFAFQQWSRKYRGAPSFGLAMWYFSSLALLPIIQSLLDPLHFKFPMALVEVVIGLSTTYLNSSWKLF